jgi:sigma-B regulation protein RsbU (phosphoserine phosphatase)
MRTRAVFYIVLGVLILAALLAADLIAHGYKALQGVSFELFRAILQGVALSWLLRGAYTLFFRRSTIVRAGDNEEAVLWPAVLAKRFIVVSIASFALGFLPLLFRLSLSKQYAPQTFPTVISIDFMGALWLCAMVAVTLSFWQLTFVRQQTRFARRRFGGWAIAAGIYSLVYFLIRASVIPDDPVEVAVLSVVGVGVVVAAVLLGYRVPWVPHLPRPGKRKLIWLSLSNVVLAIGLTILYTGNSLTSNLFGDYAIYWHIASGALYGTVSIYFIFVFFSTLFSLSSTDLVERKSAEVKSLVKLTRFSSDVLSSELLLDLPRLAEQITTLAREATGTDCAWLELRSNTFAPGREHVGEVMVRSHVGIDEASAERIMATSEHFPDAGRTIESPRQELGETRKAFVLKKRGSNRVLPAQAGASIVASLHSLVAVPLLRKKEVRGGLYVGKRKEDGFDDDDLTVLSAFSDVASLALETARLLADSIEKQKFDGELRAARAMQKSLIPEKFPDIAGYDIDAFSIPAYDVGGDFYDSTVLFDGSMVIVIGDVSGKGISASMYMAETKGVVQGMAPLMHDMPELLQGANNALLRNLPAQASMRRSFVTLGMLNLSSSGVRYCRAGHTPLLIVRENGQYEILQPKGMAVGIMPQTIFNQMLEEKTIDVAPGDIIVLFSDGITDTRNAEGEDFGYTRLAEIVTLLRAEHSAKRITMGVLEHLTNFSASESYGDDATLVVIKVVAIDKDVT